VKLETKNSKQKAPSGGLGAVKSPSFGGVGEADLLDIIARLRAEMREIEELTQTEKNREMKFIKVIIESGLNVE